MCAADQCGIYGKNWGCLRLVLNRKTAAQTDRRYFFAYPKITSRPTKMPTMAENAGNLL